MFTIHLKTFNQLSEHEKTLIKTNIVNNKQFLTNKQKSVIGTCFAWQLIFLPVQSIHSKKNQILCTSS